MKTTRMRVGAIATACALVGAGAGIAGSSAATSKSNSGSAAKTTKKRATGSGAQGPGDHPWGRGGPGGPGGPGMGHHGGPAVHTEAVVLNEAANAYITRTMDEGLVKSVSGEDLVITEGTKAVPYKDVAMTVPSGATITRNGKTAQLPDLKAGDHVHVISSSDGTLVFAGDDTFRPMGPMGPGEHGEHGRDHDGPPPAGAPMPPAGAPTPPPAP